MFKILHIFLFITLFLSLTAVNLGQEKVRNLDINSAEYRYPNSPVVIVGVDEAKRPVKDTSTIIGDKDWVRNLTLRVKNISERTITFIVVELVVHDERRSPTRSITRIEFGRPVAVANSLGVPSGVYERPVLRPGQSVSLNIDATVFEQWNKRLQELGLADPETVAIDLNYVHFEDDTIWTKGEEMFPDPLEKGRYTPQKKTN